MIKSIRFASPARPKAAPGDRLVRRCCSLLLGVTLAPLCLSGAAGVARADGPSGYLLGPQDRIRLKVFEWRASRAEIHAWTALNDEFTIAADGTLSIPIAGEIPAAGFPSREVGRVIGARLRERLDLAETPDAAVEVVQYRPFFINGHVDKPGEYAFRPGLTIAKAFALAGGLPRSFDPAFLRLEREVISGRGELVLLLQDREQLMARLARLLAERDDRPTIEFARELSASSNPSVKLLIEREISIFDARRKALKAHVEAIEDLKRFLRMQLETLDRQTVTADVQLKLFDTETRTNQQLVDRGLATQPRQLALGRAMAQMESEKLRINTDILRAREAVTRADMSILEQRSKRATEVSVDLRETQGSLDRLKQRIETTERLVLEAEVVAPRLLAERGAAKRAKPTFRIIRSSADGSAELRADETTAILPGDTMTVDPPSTEVRPWSISAGEAAIGSSSSN